MDNNSVKYRKAEHIMSKSEIKRYLSQVPQINIGQYRIYQIEENKVWIVNIEDEGMETSEKLLEPVIHKFFEDNF